MEKKSVGGAWITKSKAGKTYMNVRIGEEKYRMFKNEFKTKDKHPHYVIYPDKPKEVDDMEIADIPF